MRPWPGESWGAGMGKNPGGEITKTPKTPGLNGGLANQVAASHRDFGVAGVVKLSLGGNEPRRRYWPC